MQHKQSVRSPALDLIRCLALLCVICAHFFNNTEFYYVYITGSRMYLLTLIRTFCMTCVPMFIMLSGYLLHKKQPNRSYYVKLVKTLTIYFLASACCYLYAQFLAPNAPGTASLGELIRKTLSFRAVPYSWYINMYLGLFLLIPYLNLIFQSLQTEKARRQLIVILIIMTALPGILNMFYYDGGWFYIGTDHAPDPLVPDYWHEFYPVTYYFLGSYLREHPLKLKARTALVLSIAVFILNGTVTYLLCGGNYFPLNARQEHEALPMLIQAVLVFQYFTQRDYSHFSPGICRFFSWMSEATLGAYLVSWIFDSIFYPILNRIQPVFAYQIPYLPVIVLAIYCCSLILSGVLNGIYNLSQQLFTRLISKKSSV